MKEKKGEKKKNGSTFQRNNEYFWIGIRFKSILNGTIENFCLAWHHLSFGTWIDDNIDNCDHFCYRQNPI